MKIIPSIAALIACAVAAFPSSDSALGQTDPSQSRTLITADGWPIHINYYESTGGKESPVVILFPGVEGKDASMTRKVWTGAATALHKKQFAVVTADLRKHGDSLPEVEDNKLARLTTLGSNDYALMATQDLEAIKDFLLQEHQSEKLNIRKLGIATAGSGCLVAAAFAQFDWAKKPWPDSSNLLLRTPKGQDVRALFMLSPKTTVRGINATATIRAIAAYPIAAHIWFNPGVREEKADAEKLFKYLEIKDPAMGDVRKLNEGPEDETGKVFSTEGLLQGKAAAVMEKNITEYFDQNLTKLESPWKSRKSRLFE